MLTFATGDNFIFIWLFNRISPLMKHFYFCISLVCTTTQIYKTFLNNVKFVLFIIEVKCRNNRPVIICFINYMLMSH